MNELASLGRRAAAAAVDLVLTCAVAAGVVLVARVAGLRSWIGAAGAVVVVVAVLGVQLLTRALLGWTVGGALLGLRTVDERWGTPVGPLRALRRALVVVGGALVVGVGALVVIVSPAFDRDGRRRGWHDRVAGTVVLHRVTEPSPVTQVLAAVHPSSGPAAAARPASGPGEPPALVFGLMPELEQTRPAPAHPLLRADVVDAYQPAQAELELSDGTRRAVRGTVLVGRNPVAGAGRTALRLPDPSRSLSRTHARLVVSHLGVSVADLGSTNGTVVQLPGGGRVVCASDRTVQLPVGSFVGFGDCWVRLVDASTGRQPFPEPAAGR